MNGDPCFTDEELNRYIDGELEDKTRSRLEDRQERDPVLAARVRELRSVDQAVREAFDGIEPPVRHRPHATPRPGRRGMAAAAMLLPAGILVGWLGHSLLGVPELHDPLAGGINLPAQERQHLNTVLHLDVGEPAVMAGVLDRAAAILTAYAGQGVQVEVVANAAGLNLLRADKSAYAGRVRAMMDKYPTLAFVACANTLRRLKEQGVEVPLIERAHARETALDHIVERLREGWTYIKI
jgi:intracellular sulfur oxidation DsrE/DsrF family protein